MSDGTPGRPGTLSIFVLDGKVLLDGGDEFQLTLESADARKLADKLLEAARMLDVEHKRRMPSA